jgi:cell division protein YceG involved in septum cleavage
MQAGAEGKLIDQVWKRIATSDLPVDTQARNSSTLASIVEKETGRAGRASPASPRSS